jgi:SAM-dependent methyltransferase
MHPLELARSICRSKKEFEAYLARQISVDRYCRELEIARLHQTDLEEPFELPGFCPFCEKAVSFVVFLAGGERVDPGTLVPNWREQLKCPSCGMNNRQRLVAAWATGLAGEKLQTPNGTPLAIYLTEQVTPIFRALTDRFGAESVIGSEYIAPDYPSGAIREDSIRHEDVEQLSFPNRSFDFVLSCDVFEHVNDPDQGFQEIARVLRPGGRFIMTVPFYSLNESGAKRSSIENGELHHHLPEQYHGNPMSEKGSLVFSDFGWDLLDRIRAAGFAAARADYYWSEEYGHLGTCNPVFYCEKAW